MNLGVIGYGLRSKVLIGAAASFDGVRLAAIANLSQAARERAESDHPEAELLDDYTAMLELGEVGGFAAGGGEELPADHGLHKDLRMLEAALREDVDIADKRQRIGASHLTLRP